MESRSTARFMQISARKVRLIIDEIRGADVERALEFLRLSRTRAARMVEKVLQSAIASAVELHDVDAEELFVKKTWADVGPTRTWRRPRARGMWTPIRARTSHISVIVSDASEAEAAEAAEAETGGA